MRRCSRRSSASLVGGCAWSALPSCFGVIEVDGSPQVPDLVEGRCVGPAAQRILHRLDDAALLDLSRAVLDSARVRAEKKGRAHRSEPRGPRLGSSDRCNTSS